MAITLAGLALAASLAGQPPDGFTFAAGGDMIGPYRALPIKPDPGFQQAITLFKSADLGFANQEGSIFDLKNFPGTPAAENGGGYPLQPSSFARDLKSIGISLVSKANNHATDWGTEGLKATLGWLTVADVTAGGAGAGLDAARAPVYRDTAKGRIALVDTASTFPPMAVAGPPVARYGITSKARIGISPLHVREVGRISAGQLGTMRQISGALNIGGGTHEARLGDQFFSDQPGPRWEMDRDDESTILNSVKTARAHAKFVLFSIHAHQTAGDVDPGGAPFEPMVLHWANEAASGDDPRPADFEPALFHAAIDAGADAVVRTGPHVLGGIEIYKGKPIFYSLGSLFFDFHGKRTYLTPTGQTMRFPDTWYETVIPVTRYAHGRLAEIRLYPFAIDDTDGVNGGMPKAASPEEARKILENLKAMSAAFGTRISIENGVGVIWN
jgi:poly-gamma-glutamate synthesis protein (capsule biosynthesis protein)